MDKRYLLEFTRLPAASKQKIMLAGMIGLLFVAIASEAKVYLRWGVADNIGRFVAGIGGKRAYKAELNVNGTPAQISVYGLPKSERAWANSVNAISYHADDRFTSLTGVTLSGSPILFQYQRQSSQARSSKDPFMLPRFPQSTQAFYAHNQNANIHISVSRSSASPSQVREFYRGAMQAAGWHATLAADEASRQGMAVFIREQEVACVAVEQVNESNETRITLLHKQLQIK